MKLLYRLRSLLASRRARSVRLEALREYRDKIHRARALERRSVRLRKLSSGKKFLSKPPLPERLRVQVPASGLFLPRVREVLAGIVLVRQ